MPPLTMPRSFWRIILDEAQLVRDSGSVAALAAGELTRRNAWVMTGAPPHSPWHCVHLD